MHSSPGRPSTPAGRGISPGCASSCPGPPLARRGVDPHHEGRGLGAGLLQDVFLSLFALSKDIGCRALLIHAESNDARDFYRHLVPEFEDSPTAPLHLVLLMKDIRRT